MGCILDAPRAPPHIPSVTSQAPAVAWVASSVPASTHFTLTASCPTCLPYSLPSALQLLQKGGGGACLASTHAAAIYWMGEMVRSGSGPRALCREKSREHRWDRQPGGTNSLHWEVGSVFFSRLNLGCACDCFDQENTVEVMLCHFLTSPLRSPPFSLSSSSVIYPSELVGWWTHRLWYLLAQDCPYLFQKICPTCISLESSSLECDCLSCYYHCDFLPWHSNSYYKFWCLTCVQGIVISKCGLCYWEQWRKAFFHGTPLLASQGMENTSDDNMQLWVQAKCQEQQLRECLLPANTTPGLTYAAWPISTADISLEIATVMK